MLSPAPWPSPTWLPFPSASLRVSKMASLGHSGRQAPQEMHSSVISNAITLASFPGSLSLDFFPCRRLFDKVGPRLRIHDMVTQNFKRMPSPCQCDFSQGHRPEDLFRYEQKP